MISQTLCTSFKQELFLAVHDFSVDTFKLALYTANANLGADTTVYTSSGEVASAYTTNVLAVATGILQGATGVEPGLTLFKNTVVASRPLGDITGDGSVLSQDSAAYLSWGAGTNVVPEQVAWIEGTLNPYMFANPGLYAAYLVPGTGYSAGGRTLTGATVNTSGTTAYVDFDSPTWTPAAFTCRGGLIYNASKGNKAVAVLDFGADKTALTQFTVTMPANTVTSALIRLP